MKLDGRSFITFVISLALIPGAYGIEAYGGISATTEAGGFAQGNTVVNSNGAISIASSENSRLDMKYLFKLFPDENHWVQDKAGKHAEVTLYVDGGTLSGYKSTMMPEGKERKLKTQEQTVSAKQVFTINDASWIFAEAKAWNKEGDTASANVDVSQGSLIEYTGEASATDTEAKATQSMDVLGDSVTVAASSKNDNGMKTSVTSYVKDGGGIETLQQTGTTTLNNVKITQSIGSAHGGLVGINAHAENKAPAYEGETYLKIPLKIINKGTSDFIVGRDGLLNTFLSVESTPSTVDISTSGMGKSALILEPFETAFVKNFFNSVGKDLADRGYAVTDYGDSGVSWEKVNQLDEYTISMINTHGFDAGSDLTWRGTTYTKGDIMGLAISKGATEEDRTKSWTELQQELMNQNHINELLIIDGCGAFKTNADGTTPGRDAVKNSYVSGSFNQDVSAIHNGWKIDIFFDNLCAGQTVGEANIINFLGQPLSIMEVMQGKGYPDYKLGSIPIWGSLWTVKLGELIQPYINRAIRGDTISIASGIFLENLVIDKSITLQGSGSTESGTVVDGKGTGSVFTIGTVDPNIDVTLSNMLIQNGVRNGIGMIDPSGYVLGGGIVNKGRLTVDHCTITDNGYSRGNWGDSRPMTLGGGIYSSGDLTVISSTISGNEANCAGGIYLDNHGISPSELKAEITDSIISTNEGQNGAGGIYNNGGHLILTGSEITGNVAGYYGNGAGGIVNRNTGIIEMVSGTVSGNSGYGGSGVQNYGTFTMKDGSISNNIAYNGPGGTWATSSGGGVANSGTFNLEGGSISDNYAYRGGGVYNSGTFNQKGGSIINNIYTHSDGTQWIPYDGGSVYNTGTFNLEAGSIYGNKVYNNGGGIFNEGSAIIKEGSSISLNIADSNADGEGNGGGIFNSGGSLTFQDQYGNPTTDPNVIDSTVYNNYLQSITGPLSNIAP